jgi:hypothetical protein
MSFNIKNNNANFTCAPMYNSNNDQIMGYMCSPSKNIENFTSKISKDVCKEGYTLNNRKCEAKCPSGFTDISGSLVCSKNKIILKNSYKAQGPLRNQCKPGYSFNKSANTCVSKCPTGFVDISNGQCSRTYYSNKKTYTPVSGKYIVSTEGCKSGYTLNNNTCMQTCPIGFTDNNGTVTCSEQKMVVKKIYAPNTSSGNICNPGDYLDKTLNSCTTPCPIGFIDTRNGKCIRSQSFRRKTYKL